MDDLTLFLNAPKDGLHWYAEAHDQCAALAEELSIPVWKAVALVAVISPKCPWDKNIEYARNLITRKGACGALGPNKLKAKKIMRLKTTKALFNHLRGQKVQSFYWNILRRGFDTNVTVDTHMLQLFEPERASVQQAVYRRISERVIAIARMTGYAPAQVQACLWNVQRGKKNKESGYHN